MVISSALVRSRQSTSAGSFGLVRVPRRVDKIHTLGRASNCRGAHPTSPLSARAAYPVHARARARKCRGLHRGGWVAAQGAAAGAAAGAAVGASPATPQEAARRPPDRPHQHRRRPSKPRTCVIVHINTWHVALLQAKRGVYSKEAPEGWRRKETSVKTRTAAAPVRRCRHVARRSSTPSQKIATPTQPPETRCRPSTPDSQSPSRQRALPTGARAPEPTLTDTKVPPPSLIPRLAA